jgi:classical protein kinase C beta type
MAPEMVQGMPYDYTIDIWALGILLFEMVAGVAPFRGESPEEVLGEMKRAIFFSEKFGTEGINARKGGNQPHKAYTASESK